MIERTLQERAAYLQGFENGAKEILRKLGALNCDLTAELMEMVISERIKLDEDQQKEEIDK